MIKKTVYFIAITLLFYQFDCSASILSQRGSYLKAYHNGHLEQAETNINTLIRKEIPNGNYSNSIEASWLLLDRATIRFAMGNIDGAINDYTLALDALDYYSQDLSAEKLKQVLFQDETGAYQASDFEQVLARLYFSLALIYKGDFGNATALLRNAEEYQQAKLAVYAKIPFMRTYRMPENNLCRYLFAALLEKKGDFANANILYGQVSSEISTTAENRNQARLIVLCHNGNAPYKISTTSSASVASAIALEFFLSSRRIDPAWSSLSGIPVSVLQQWPWSDPQPTYAEVDNCTQPLLPLFSVKNAAADELNQKMPIIVARGVSRLLLRRSAVGFVQHQNDLLGVLADISMWFVNSNTRADTRSWTTLPAFIDVTRFDLTPGRHTLTVQVYENNNHKSMSYELNLQPNDLCIVHVFNIHPGVTTVLIPSHYISTGEKL